MDYYYNLLKSAQKNAAKSEKKVKELASFSDSTKTKSKNGDVDPEAVRKFLEKSKQKEEMFKKTLEEKLKAQEERRKQERIELLRKKGLLKEETVEQQKPSAAFLPQGSEFHARANSSQSASAPSPASNTQTKNESKSRPVSSDRVKITPPAARAHPPPPKPKLISYTFEDMMKAAKKNMETPFGDHLKAAMMESLNTGAKKRSFDEASSQSVKSSKEEKHELPPPPVKKKKLASETSLKVIHQNPPSLPKQDKTKRPPSSQIVKGEKSIVPSTPSSKSAASSDISSKSTAGFLKPKPKLPDNSKPQSMLPSVRAVGIAAQQSNGKIGAAIPKSGKSMPPPSFTPGIAAQQSNGKVRIGVTSSGVPQSSSSYKPTGIAAQLSNGNVPSNSSSVSKPTGIAAQLSNGNVPSNSSSVSKPTGIAAQLSNGNPLSKMKQVPQPLSVKTDKVSGAVERPTAVSLPPSQTKKVASSVKGSSNAVVSKSSRDISTPAQRSTSMPIQRLPPKDVPLTGIAAQLGATLNSSVSVRKRSGYYSDEEYEDEDDYDDDFIDDSEVPSGPDYSKVIKVIHQTMKFDPTKYAAIKPWDDCRDMVSNFAEIEKEEKRSLRLARQEDLEEEKRLEIMKKKRH